MRFLQQIMRTFPGYLFFCALVSLGMFLAGCSALMESGASAKKNRTLAESSYSAADMLIQQSRSFITPSTPLEIGMLTGFDSPDEKTNFGQIVAEQIASRFVQLGYSVSASASHGVSGLETAAAAMPMGVGSDNPAAPLIITGRYAVARDDVLVNLRIVEAGTGRVVAAYDYPVPKTRDVRELVKTQADKESFFDF